MCEWKNSLLRHILVAILCGLVGTFAGAWADSVPAGMAIGFGLITLDEIINH